MGVGGSGCVIGFWGCVYLFMLYSLLESIEEGEFECVYLFNTTSG